MRRRFCFLLDNLILDHLEHCTELQLIVGDDSAYLSFKAALAQLQIGKGSV